MNQYSNIDGNLDVYKKNTVIIWGTGSYLLKTKNLLNYHGITVLGFTWSEEITEEGIPFISATEIKKICEASSVTIQISSYAWDTESVVQSLVVLGVRHVITAKEGWQYFRFLQQEKLYQNHPHLQEELMEYEKANLIMDRFDLRKYLIHCFGEPAIIVNLPSKTGHHTIVETFKKYNIPYYMTKTSPSIFDRKVLDSFAGSGQPIKIITAVREPISQNISYLYELITALYTGRLNFDIDFKSMETFLSKGEENVQTLFDERLKNTQYLESDTRPSHVFPNIQQFMNEFSKNVMDFTMYPFYKERGYSIYKEGNVEVFLYQLEKMDECAAAMSKFLNKEFSSFIRGNQATDKWIANSYKKAQNELMFSQEYFDKSFAEPYVTHCYSAEDIEKMKEKWRGNIRN